MLASFCPYPSCTPIASINGRLLLVSRLQDAEIATRLAEWRRNPPPIKVPEGYTGVLTKYAATAGMAHTGALVGTRGSSGEVAASGPVVATAGL